MTQYDQTILNQGSMGAYTTKQCVDLEKRLLFTFPGDSGMPLSPVIEKPPD